MLNYYRTNKIFHLFANRILRYLVIFLVLFVLLIPVVIMSYRNVKNNILNSHKDSINKGLYHMETQIHAVVGLSNIIANEKNYHTLSSIVGHPKNHQYIDIRTFQRSIASLSTTHEYIKDMCVLFEKNPIYISNTICSDDYKSVYPYFFHEDNKTAEEWYEEIFSDSTMFKMNSHNNVYSFYSLPQNYNTFTYMMRISPYNTMKKDSMLICHVDFDEIVKTMVHPDIIDNCFLYITDINNNILAKYQYSEETLIEKNTYIMDNRRYAIVASERSDSGLQAILGIPESYFQGQIKSSFFIVECYFLLGIICVFLFYFIISLRETVFMRRMVTTASSLFPIEADSKENFNEYSYISSILKNNANELDALNQQVRIFTLENLFLNNTQYNTNQIKELFHFSFDAYCVVVIRLEQCDTEFHHKHYLFTLEDLCDSFLKLPFLAAHTNINEISILLALDDSHLCDFSKVSKNMLHLQDQFQKQIQQNITFHIGISGISTGIEHIHDAFLQAKDTISIFASPNTSGVFVYDKPRQIILQKSLDVSLLIKCYDGILCGDVEVVKLFFEHIDKILKKGYYDHQEPLQLLFSIRQPIYNAYLEIFSTNEANNVSTEIKPPVINLQKVLTQNISVLKDFAFELCAHIQSQKQSRQKQLKENILEYIRTNCFDVNFSIFMVIDEFHVSENFVLQLIKEATGKSFKTYVEFLRVEKADYMLKNTNETNAKIALACGFGSENTFYRAFARKHGVTPSKWSRDLNP